MPDYEVYGNSDVPWELQEAVGAPAGGDDGPWQVLVEYSNQGQAKPPTILQIDSREHASRDDALMSAHQVAFEFEPPDPFSLQGRSVYRDGPDGYVVVLQGAMSTFHMSVRAVQHVGDA